MARDRKGAVRVVGQRAARLIRPATVIRLARVIRAARAASAARAARVARVIRTRVIGRQGNAHSTHNRLK